MRTPRTETASDARSAAKKTAPRPKSALLRAMGIADPEE